MPWDNSPEKRRQDAQTYGSAEYKRNRTVAMRRDQWRCQIRTAGICIGAASTCDHITPVSQGGSNRLDNLQAACQPCHAAKSAQEGGGYRAQDRPAQDPAPRPRTEW
jgi:5-methylcytosine-specific restriction enzyme A